MNKVFTVFISLIFFAEGMMFYNHYSYTHHVDQVKDKLNQLEQILDGNTSKSPLGASLLGIYEPKDDFGDIELRNLTKKIINLTEYAIENADDINEVKKLDRAISEIAAVQEKEVELFKQTMEKVEAEDIEKDIEHNYHKAVDLKDKVAEANTEIQEAIENDQEFIEIDIVTEKDKSHDSGAHHEKQEKKKDTSHTTPKKNANLERIEQLDAADNDIPRHDSDDHRRPRFDEGARRGNAYEARQGAVHRHGEVGLAESFPDRDHRCNPP